MGKGVTGSSIIGQLAQDISLVRSHFLLAAAADMRVENFKFAETHKTVTKFVADTTDCPAATVQLSARKSVWSQIKTADLF